MRITTRSTTRSTPVSLAGLAAVAAHLIAPGGTEHTAQYIPPMSPMGRFREGREPSRSTHRDGRALRVRERAIYAARRRKYAIHGAPGHFGKRA